jgi:hypothetical protein
VTRVIGKAPIEVCDTPVVSITYPDKIRVESKGYNNGREFTVYGDLSVACAANLVVSLRESLRKIRAERTRHYERQVLEAEKDLP